MESAGGGGGGGEGGRGGEWRKRENNQQSELLGSFVTMPRYFELVTEYNVLILETWLFLRLFNCNNNFVYILL